MTYLGKGYCHLSLLMAAMNITTKELAATLHVDQSLVSKWRNNKRHLSTNSAYLAPLSHYLLEIDTSKQLNVLSSILSSFDSEVDLENPEEKLNCLARWLTSSSPLEPPVLALLAKKTHSYEATIRVWNGLSGRQEAVLFFLDQVLSLPNPTKLMLVSQEDIAWLTENLDFLEQWQAKLMAILKKGHTISIVHWVDRSANIINSIIKYWLPLHLTGKIQSWYAPLYVDLPYQKTIFIAENNFVLSGISSSLTPRNIFSTFAADPGSLQQYTTVFNSMVKQYERFINVVAYANLPELMGNYPDNITSKETFYCLFSALPLALNSPDLLQEILFDQDLPLDTQNRVISFLQKLNSFYFVYPIQKSIPMCYMIDEQALHQYISEESLSLELSFLLEKPVYLSKKQRLKQLQEIIKLVETSSAIEFGLSTSTEKIPLNLSVYPNQLVIAYSELAQFPYALSATESTVVNAANKYLESMWYKIPRIKRNKKDVTEVLKSLLQI